MSSRDVSRQLLIVVAVAVVSGLPHIVAASGHGPVFGMTTPTNAAGEWSFDLGLMGRSGKGDDGSMTRGMLTYGFTEDIQISVSAPLLFGSGPFSPARGTAMMPGSGDFEGIGAWRFHRQGALNFAYVYGLAPRLRAVNQSCPVDEATACATADRVSRVVLWISAAIYVVGFFAAYLLGPILVWSES